MITLKSSTHFLYSLTSFVSPFTLLYVFPFLSRILLIFYLIFFTTSSFLIFFNICVHIHLIDLVSRIIVSVLTPTQLCSLYKFKFRLSWGVSNLCFSCYYTLLYNSSQVHHSATRISFSVWVCTLVFHPNVKNICE